MTLLLSLRGALATKQSLSNPTVIARLDRAISALLIYFVKIASQLLAMTLITEVFRLSKKIPLAKDKRYFHNKHKQGRRICLEDLAFVYSPAP